MPDRPTRTLVLIALTALLALAGCGDDEGGGESATTSPTTSSTTSDAGSTDTGSGAATGETPSQGPTDTEQIETAIEAFLVSPDSKEVCNELVTENLLRTAYGDLQGCLRGRGTPTLASSAEIDELEISGAEASATAVPKGGLYAGSDIDFTLVLDDASWRIDSVKADIPVGP